jgi:hypothetical protein
MPGWTTGDNWHNNIAYTPGTWIALHRICERHGVGDQFRIHYDPSHAILMGQDTRSVFQYLKDAGYNFLIGGFHVKGQVIDAKGVAGWGYAGQTVERGDWNGERPSDKPADQPRTPGRSNTRLQHEHELPGTGALRSARPYLAEPRTVDFARSPARRARSCCSSDVRQTPHLVGRARVSEGAPPGSQSASSRSCQGAFAFGRPSRRRRPPACTRCKHEVLGVTGIPIQGRRSAGVPVRKVVGC